MKPSFSYGKSGGATAADVRLRPRLLFREASDLLPSDGKKIHKKRAASHLHYVWAKTLDSGKIFRYIDCADGSTAT